MKISEKCIFVLFTYGQMFAVDKYGEKFHTHGTKMGKTGKNIVILPKATSEDIGACVKNCIIYIIIMYNRCHSERSGVEETASPCGA